MELRLEGIHHEPSPGLWALVDLDLRVRSGELVCLLGPNGAGKSTLLRIAAGLWRPTRGNARVDGVPLGELGPRRRARRLAFVPQSLAALPRTTVEAFVLGARYAHARVLDRALGRTSPSDRAACERALEEADALAWRHRPLEALSGGERQRVLLARALAQEAPALLFDEPTRMLDPEHRVRVFSLLERARAGGRLVLVATHELALAGAFADRCVLLREGRIAAEGPPDALLRPEVLGPVFGPNLHYASAPRGERERPFAVAWPFRAAWSPGG